MALPGSEPSQATDPRTAATMREMMEDVVLEGTGKLAQLNGYTAAGKSGTAQKIDPATGRYSATQYNASFVGFAPVNDPAVTILVVLDSPMGAHHGGEVGGPVFKRIAEQVLAYLDVPHDVPSPSDTEMAKNLHPTKGPSARNISTTDASKGRLRRRQLTEESARACSHGCVRQSRLDCSSQSRGSDRPRRNRSLLASWARALADWQRCCTRTVPGGGNERPAWQQRDSTVRSPRGSFACEHARGWKLRAVAEGIADMDSESTNKNAVPEMSAADLIEGVDAVRVSGPANVRISSVAYDSRKVARGALFFALPGEKVDGFRFVDDAIARGAAAIASSHPRPLETAPEITWIELAAGKERRALARAAANFYGQPANALKLVGVTGTNGKTTTAIPRRFDSARGGIHRRPDWHDRLSHTEGQPPGAEHHSRIARPAADVRGGARRGRHACRARSQFARAGDGPSVGLPFCRRHFHESDARPSGLSQDFRGVFRRQAATV